MSVKYTVVEVGELHGRVVAQTTYSGYHYEDAMRYLGEGIANVQAGWCRSCTMEVKQNG